MPFRDIVVHVANGTTAGKALDAAFGLARDHEARLIGVAVQQPAVLLTDGFGPLAPSILEDIEATSSTEVAEAKMRFDAASERFGYTGKVEWRVGRGAVTDVLALHGRYADVIMVDQTDPGQDLPSFGIPAELALMSGRPVLTVPYIGAQQPIGGRVVVAWNASREAARAVADALPILTRAQRVDVLAVSPDNIGDLPGGDIARHLAAHGVTANVEIRAGAEIDAGQEILNFLSDSGADLLVMGCYGHPRFQQMIFGGVTRTILREMTVPVLLSH